MKNIEKYYDVLAKQTDFICYANNEILKNKHCGNVPCSECNKKVLNWLNQEYEEPIKLTDDEKAILRNLHKKYKWIARDGNGDIYIFPDKPVKYESVWDYCGIESKSLIFFSHLFKFIKWSDEEPYSIEELLKENER